MQAGYYKALFYSVVLHGLLLGFLAVSFGWQQFTAASVPPPLAIQAAVVDESLIAAELEKLEAADERIRAAEAQRQRELDEQAAKARAEREREEQRLAELERQRVAAEQRQREEQQERDQAEQQRKQAEQQRREREQQAAAERKAKEEAEKQRLAELEAERVREEKRVAALAEKRRQEEAARREAARQAEREEQLRRQIAEETARREAEEAGLLDEYKTLISQRIVRNWIQPPTAQHGLRCELLLTQIPGGEVTDVKIVTCNGDAAVVRSIEAAVYKASPLPPPPDPRLFERRVRVLFEPEN